MNADLIIPAVGGIVVALIGGGISLVLAILAKDQKTSEFRQAWIEGVRDDVSKLVAHFIVIGSMAKVIRIHSQQEIHEYVLSKEPHFLEISQLVTRIRLRMNKEEHAEFLRLIIQTQVVGAADKQYEQMIEDLVFQSQVILKSEWTRVKRGERSFRWLKWISAILLVVGVVGGAWAGYLHLRDIP